MWNILKIAVLLIVVVCVGWCTVAGALGRWRSIPWAVGLVDLLATLWFVAYLVRLAFRGR